MNDTSLTYSERESKTLEFKSRLPDFIKLIKTCIAFANGVGGQILIGIEDETKEVIGITDKERDRLYDEFPNSLYDSVNPTLLPQIYEKRIGDKSILIIQIPPSPKKPYFLKSDGFPKGVYVRVGSNTRRANQEYIEDLVREGNRLNFDEELIQQDMNVLSKDLLEKFYGKHFNFRKVLSDRVLTLSATTQDTYCPTVTGILFFTEDPHLYVHEAIVICTLFKGDSGREIIRTQEITGPLEKLAEDSFRLVHAWMASNYKLSGVRLKGESPIPEKAIREAIINGLIHRKYSIPGAVKISIYEHHLEIFSPGCFPGLVDLENLGDGTTFLRNPHIARIAHRMGLVEKLGSGIRLIFDSCKEAGLKQPKYEEGTDSVKITFYYEHVKQAGQSDEDAIFSLKKNQNELTVQDVIQYLNVSRNTATRKLNKLVEEKKLIRLGKGPAVRYRSVKSM
jgi:ATP-dependent DNA helicase RecG